MVRYEAERNALLHHIQEQKEMLGSSKQQQTQTEERLELINSQLKLSIPRFADKIRELNDLYDTIILNSDLQSSFTTINTTYLDTSAELDNLNTMESQLVYLTEFGSSSLHALQSLHSNTQQLRAQQLSIRYLSITLSQDI